MSTKIYMALLCVTSVLSYAASSSSSSSSSSLRSGNDIALQIPNGLQQRWNLFHEGLDAYKAQKSALEGALEIAHSSGDNTQIKQCEEALRKNELESQQLLRESLNGLADIMVSAYASIPHDNRPMVRLMSQEIAKNYGASGAYLLKLATRKADAVDRKELPACSISAQQFSQKNDGR